MVPLKEVGSRDGPWYATKALNALHLEYANRIFLVSLKPFCELKMKG